MGEGDVFVGEAERQYVESLQERVTMYEQDAIDTQNRLLGLREHVRARLVAVHGWTEDQVDELLEEPSG